MHFCRTICKPEEGHVIQINLFLFRKTNSTNALDVWLWPRSWSKETENERHIQHGLASLLGLIGWTDSPTTREKVSHLLELLTQKMNHVNIHLKNEYACLTLTGLPLKWVYPGKWEFLLITHLVIAHLLSSFKLWELKPKAVKQT